MTKTLPPELAQDERASVVPPDFAEKQHLRLIHANGVGRPAISCRGLGRC